MSSGVVPQHPPTIVAPADRHVTADAPGSGRSPSRIQDLDAASHVEPTFGYTRSGFVDLGAVQQRRDEPGRRAVHADGDHAIARCGERHRVGERRPVADACAVATTERDPRPRLGVVLEQGHQRFGLDDRGDRLDRQEVGFGLEERLEPRPVEHRERPRRQAVVAAILRAVGQRGAERSHRGRHQSIGSVGRGGFASERHAEAHQRRGLLRLDAAVGEPGERGLVARRDRDVGPGVEERFVHAPDRPGIVLEEPGRPERVAQVGAATFEFGGHPAVEDQRTLEAFLHVRRHPSTLPLRRSDVAAVVSSADA